MVQALACPACRCPLVGLGEREAELPVCEGCGGVWLDKALSRRVVAGALAPDERRLARIAGKRARSRPRRGGYRSAAPAEDAARSCPVCSTPLVPRTVETLDIVVDACDRHGSWFDRGELRVVIRWFELRAAGLDPETARLALMLRGLRRRSPRSPRPAKGPTGRE